MRVLVVCGQDDERLIGSSLRRSLAGIGAAVEQVRPEDLTDLDVTGPPWMDVDVVAAVDHALAAVGVAVASAIPLLLVTGHMTSVVVEEALHREPRRVNLLGVELDGTRRDVVLDHLVCRPTNVPSLRIAAADGRSSITREVAVDTGDPLRLRTELPLRKTSGGAGREPMLISGDGGGRVDVQIDNGCPFTTHTVGVLPAAFCVRLLHAG